MLLSTFPSFHFVQRTLLSTVDKQSPLFSSRSTTTHCVHSSRTHQTSNAETLNRDAETNVPEQKGRGKDECLSMEQLQRASCRCKLVQHLSPA